MDRLEQFPPIWTVLDDYPLFNEELAPEMTLSEILDDFDRHIAPMLFADPCISYDPSALFWAQPPPALVTAPRAAVAGLRHTPTFGTLTHGIDPREFRPFAPPTCPVPFASPFAAARDLGAGADEGGDSASCDVGCDAAFDACDSGYESDVPPPRPAQATEGAYAFRCPVVPVLPVVPAVVRPQEVQVGGEQKLSEKALGKRRAVHDDAEEEEDEEPPRKRCRESDDDDSDYLDDDSDSEGPCSDFGSPSIGTPGTSTAIPRARAPPASNAAPRVKTRPRCLFKSCNAPGERLCFGSWKDRNRHMETHGGKNARAYACPNPACTSAFARTDALRRHCIASKSRRCARFWREGAVKPVRLPYYLICPLEQLVVPDKNDPLYEMRWA
ncbi:hypothetical protein PsYK624_147450 [Phanerochaete sordida]|uniref:Uncharacterized protein n=1 Tax=Phanerochaete sordida TaxID=48140 RepID=A0A9P3GP48_9APHY|nr:hypothetical protein PsYK624_147450 [Phanerochaete sordida]